MSTPLADLEAAGELIARRARRETPADYAFTVLGVAWVGFFMAVDVVEHTVRRCRR